MTNGENLSELEGSKEFYEERYQQGYMEEWPDDKKRRVFEIITMLGLPETGDALDFGCGNGVFTDVLLRALPGWKIHGVDLSENAVANARRRLPGCTFFAGDDPALQGRRFDFVLSHHVLEHVYNIEEVVGQIVGKLKESSAMLHILPCGNAGSFEWRLCSLRADGINAAMENRFFFEDPGHVRRMTTARCAALFLPHGFSLRHAYYSNQFFGAINWITRSHPALVPKMFNPLKGKGLKSTAQLSFLFAQFACISALRLPALAYQRVKSPMLTRLLYLPSRVSVFADKLIIESAEAEWSSKKHQDNGSEMYLHFVREPGQE